MSIIQIDLERAKRKAHHLRRVQRQHLLEPFDELAKDPSRVEEAEANKRPIRQQSAVVQSAIEHGKNADELTTILKQENMI